MSRAGYPSDTSRDQFESICPLLEQARNACSTFLIVDAQSVKNTDTTMDKGYDAGQEGLGHQASYCGGYDALARCEPALSRLQSVLCDSGYTGQPFCTECAPDSGRTRHCADSQAQ